MTPRLKLPTVVLAAIASLCLVGCRALNVHGATPSPGATLDRIQAEARAYALPGHSVVVFDASGITGERYEGAADLASDTPVTAATVFPVASLTKMWSAVVVLQLVDEGRLRLDQPVVELLPDVRLPSTVHIQHLLSHTSQGVPGHHFHYDGRRYSLLSRVIETASGEPFAQAVHRRIIDRLALRDTFLIGSSADETPRVSAIATPYRHDEDHALCDIEYGHSASAGLVSTARDVAAFERALLEGELLPPEQLARVLQPFSTGPSALGSFVQTLDDRRLVWAYGQFDCHAALTVFDPAQGSGMVFMANNNTPADSARLLYGDMSTSPIMLAWLGVPEDTLLYKRAAIVREAFFAQADPERLKAAINSADDFLDRYPEQRLTPDLAFVHALATLKNTVSRMQRLPLTRFDAAIRAKAEAVLVVDADNPYAHYALASLLTAQGDHARARIHFQAIVSAPNASRNWYTREAEAALSDADTLH